MEKPPKYRIKNAIWIEPEIFYSKAFEAIKRAGSTIVTLMRCLQKRKWEYQKTRRKKQVVYLDDGFIFPYDEAAFLGIGTTQHWKNIHKLIEVGFLDVIHQGGWYQKHNKEKDYSVYKFSDRWRKYGTPEFEKVEKPKVLPESSYIRKHMERQKSKSTSLQRREQLHESEDDRLKTGNDRLHKSEDDKMNRKKPETLASIA
ncbi:MAG: hypothetical protein ABSD50_02835 [Smithella sp.]|jgi:hypothetical protein